VGRGAADVVDFVRERLIPPDRAGGTVAAHGLSGSAPGFDVGIGEGDHQAARMAMPWLGNTGRNHVVDDADESILENQLLSVVAYGERIKLVLRGSAEGERGDGGHGDARENRLRVEFWSFHDVTRRYAEEVRLLAVVCLTLALVSCGGGPAATRDPAQEPWYRETTNQLTAADRQAEAAYKDGKPDDASAIIEKSEPLATKLLSVTKPTLEAVEAASDLDDLYGRMLLSNRHYGWARLLFQKNLNRWKHWQPQSDETARRYKLATSEIAECDKHID